MSDLIHHPPHYERAGLECINVIEQLDLGFNLGNVLKYIWRCDVKGKDIEDLEKAAWYLRREIGRRSGHEPENALW